MYIDYTPWLFAPALFYAVVIIGLIVIELIRETLIQKQIKIIAVLLGLVPLILILIFSLLSMAVEMLYLHPAYISKQQEFKQIFNITNSYLNNLLVMVPIAISYLVVLSVSQNRKAFWSWCHKQRSNKYKVTSTDARIPAPDSSSAYQLECNSEDEIYSQDDEWNWSYGLEFESNYWNSWGPCK